jgi:preprotein translocase subunit SecD
MVAPIYGAIADEPAKPVTVKLTPLTFTMGCVNTTGDENRQLLKRASNADSAVNAEECVDKSAQVKDARIVAVVAGKAKNIGIYEVILKLDSEDAKKLASMTLASGGPRRIVLSVKGHAILAALLNAPFHGERYLISAETADDARRISNLFID